LEFGDLVAAGETEERLFWFSALGVSGEKALHSGGEIREADGGEEFAGEPLVLVCAASDEDLIALFAGDFDAHETDVSDVVLGAGVVTACDVQVDGLVEDGETLVEEIGERDGVCLGIGGRESAALVACAGDGAAEDSPRFVAEAGVGECQLRGFEMFGGNVGYEEILPDGEADLAGAETVGDVGDGAHLCNRQAADGNGEADVMQAWL